LFHIRKRTWGFGKDNSLLLYLYIPALVYHPFCLLPLYTFRSSFEHAGFERAELEHATRSVERSLSFYRVRRWDEQGSLGTWHRLATGAGIMLPVSGGFI
jgi:hypothetical protein